MRAISLATATALGLLLAPAAAYRLALPVSAAAQPRAAWSTAGRAARASSIDMIGGNNLDGTGSFRTVQEYPCDLDVKIIGNNEGPFVDDMVTLCAERTGQKEEDISAAARCRRRSGSGRADRPRRHGLALAPAHGVALWAPGPSYSRSGALPRRGPKRWLRCCVCPSRCAMARQRQVPRDHAAAAL